MKKTMIKILSSVLVVLMLSTLVTFATEGGNDSSSLWVMRSETHGFLTTANDGITSLSGDAVATEAHSAAIYSLPLGYKDFKLSFDLTWFGGNLDEGQSGYLDNFLYLFLTDSAEFSSDVSESTGDISCSERFRITTRHIQATDVSNASASAGIVDFGGKTLNNINKGTVPMCLELENDILTLYALDGATKRGVISFTYNKDYFTYDTLRYLCVGTYNKIGFSMSNIILSETDSDYTPEPTYLTEWNMRSGLPFNTTENGITSMDENGALETADHAAAILKQPIGLTEFSLSFDLTWSEDNPHYSASDYTSKFLYLFLSDTGTFPATDNTATVYPANNKFRITQRHIQATDANGATPSANIVSLGRRSSDNSLVLLTDINEEMTARVNLTLKDNVLTFSIDGENDNKIGVISFTYDEGTFNVAKPLYLGAAVYNNVSFAINNVELKSSDYVANDNEEDNEEETTEGLSWNDRDTSNKFAHPTSESVSNIDSDGNAISSSHAASILNTPVGYKEFDVTFDLTWGQNNIPYDGTGYLSDYLFFFLSETNKFPSDDSVSSVFGASNTIMLTDRHIQAKNASGATASTGITSLGRWSTDNSYITFRSLDTTKVHLTLKDNVFTFYCEGDGKNLGTIYFTYDDGYFTDTKPIYLGIGERNNVYFNITNFSINSTDYKEIDPSYEGKWTHRTDVTNGFENYGTNGITSNGDTPASSGAAAIWNEALDGDRFVVSFDLIWDSSNLSEGQTGYLDNFLNVFVTDSLSLPAGTSAFTMPGSFRLHKGHIRAEDEVYKNGVKISERSTGIVDFGGKLLSNMTAYSKSKVYVELLRNTLYIYVMDGSTKRGTITYTFNDGYFTDSVPRYLGFALNGNIKCSVENVYIADLTGEILPPETNSLGGDGFDFAPGIYKVQAKNPLTETVNTVEAWVKFPTDVTSSETSAVVSTLYEETSSTYYALNIVGGTPTFIWNGRSFALSNVDVRTNAWTHIAFSRDKSASKMYAYINGYLKAEWTCDVADIVPTVAPYIGNNGKEIYYARGMVADVRLWSDVRTAEEIFANMEKKTTEITRTDLLANWLLTEDGTSTGTIFAETVSNNFATLKSRLDLLESVPEAENDFTVAIIPDTQVLVGGYTDCSAMEAWTQWIADNQEKEKIAFTVTVGDIVNGLKDSEFTIARAAFDILDDANVPYAVIPGNHDYNTSSSVKRDTSMFNSYFPYSQYSQYSWFGGAYEEGSMDNVYYYFTAGGIKYMVVALEFGPRDSVLEWANGIVSANADCRVIVTTHSNLNYNGELMREGYGYSVSNYKNGGYLDVTNDPPNDGIEMWDKFTSLHENIFLVVSGHIRSDDVIRRVDTGINGNQVHSMLINSQGLDFDLWREQDYNDGIDGLGMVLLLRFSDNGSKITANYYSPYLDAYLGEQNQFSLDIAQYSTTVSTPVSGSIDSNYVATVSPTNEDADTYQLWAQGADGGWKLVKGYSDANEGYEIPIEDRNAKGEYKFYIRAKNAGGEIIAQNEFILTSDNEKVRITNIYADGIINTERKIYIENAESVNITAETSVKEGIEISYTVNGEAVSDKASYKFTPEKDGIYKISVTATESANPANTDSKEITVYCTSDKVKLTDREGIWSVNGKDITADLSGRYETLAGKINEFKFNISEAGRNLGTSGFTPSTSYSFEGMTPGVYAVTAYTKNPYRNYYDDGITELVTIERESGKIGADITEIENRLSGSVIEIGDVISLTANGTADGTYSGGYQYEFLRKDAQGTVIVKNWSSDNTLTWAPAQNGTYEIIVRVRGALDENGNEIASGKGSYEFSESISYRVGDAVAFENLVLTLSESTSEEGDAVTATLPVYDNALYKFFITDRYLGTAVLTGYTPSNTVTFIPRRDGEFTVKAYVIDKDSFGYADAIASADLTVNPK